MKSARTRLAAMLLATAMPTALSAAIDPVAMQAVVTEARRLYAAVRERARQWQVEPGRRACLLRDAAGGSPRLLFIRETGTISLWLAPRETGAAPGRQAYQFYLVPLDDAATAIVANELAVALWQEPLTNSAAPGLALQLDPAGLIAKYPSGVGVILAQGEQILFADVLTPDVTTALPALLTCRGGH